MNGFTEPSLVNLAGSALFMRHAFSGSANQRPHTLAQSMDFDCWVYEQLYGEGKGAGPLQRAFLKALPVLDFTETVVKAAARTVVNNFLR